MITIKNLLNELEKVNEVAKKLGFTNLRVFKSVTPNEANCLNLLVDLDRIHPNPKLSYTSLLQAVLERMLNCRVSVTTQEGLNAFYKNSILNNLLPLNEINKLFNNDFEFGDLELDENDIEIQQQFIDMAKEVMNEYNQSNSSNRVIAATTKFQNELKDWSTLEINNFLVNLQLFVSLEKPATTETYEFNNTFKPLI